MSKDFSEFLSFSLEHSYPGCPGCVNDTDYCRCAVIEGCKVESIDSDGIAWLIRRYGLGTREVISYAFDRIISYWVREGILTFDWEADSDYYGEMLQSIQLTEESSTEIRNLVDKLKLLTDLEATHLALEVEYSSIPHNLPTGGVVIEEVKLKDIKVSNPRRLKSLTNFTNPYYYRRSSVGESIQGVLVKAGKGYSLVDGYTRLGAMLYTTRPRKITKNRKCKEITSAKYLVIS